MKIEKVKLNVTDITEFAGKLYYADSMGEICSEEWIEENLLEIPPGTLFYPVKVISTGKSTTFEEKEEEEG